MMVWLGDEVAKQFLISTGNPTYLGKPISEIDEEQLRRYRFWHGSQDLR
jgi:hypothetical protein